MLGRCIMCQQDPVELVVVTTPGLPVQILSQICPDCASEALQANEKLKAHIREKRGKKAKKDKAKKGKVK